MPRHPIPIRRLTAALALIALASSVFAQTQPPAAIAALQQTVVDVIARAERSVVAVSRSTAVAANPRAGGIVIRNGIPDPLARARQTPAAPPHAFGSGVVIDAERGLVLTQYLVVKEGEQHTLTTVDGAECPATLRGADPRSGLAVLEADPQAWRAAKVPAFEIGHAEELRKGEFVVTLGNPYAIQSDGQPTASWGMVANTARKAPAEENLNNVSDGRQGHRTTLHHFGALIQTDAKLGWNAGGGALVTLDGKLVGVTTTAAAIAGHERPAGYAIPMNDAMRRAVAAMSEGREAEYGFLGIEFMPLPGGDGGGLSVRSAFPGGPAFRAGLRAGDLIQRIGGVDIVDADTLQLAVGSLEPGSTTPVSIVRASDPQTREVTVQLGKAYVHGKQVVTQKPPAWRGMRVDYATAIPPNELRLAASRNQLDPEGCVVVTEVEPSSVSWRAGVRPYVFISHVGGKRVTTPEEFADAISGASESIKLRFTQPLTPPNAAGEEPVD
ncbi:Periplasmic pH-dependent serine endoprotease DegQ precursor [Pseudobythopirellula maris]|uniref:Periplasmic pH-dependent serine endoprotease DegQ n=1 Tax=Pseudobythopirellula maris TaxID=2527991 RepID=A0A5C5ZK48_9BACT|nr:trypsin-like peptidase domain-containing protein [Pseudobythopirellula maris]TWT87590.1 Periplasmic pH-dependent serine endoprotease DegQ precursor [Pseudobythopirellula maris]